MTEKYLNFHTVYRFSRTSQKKVKSEGEKLNYFGQKTPEAEVKNEASKSDVTNESNLKKPEKSPEFQYNSKRRKRIQTIAKSSSESEGEKNDTSPKTPTNAQKTKPRNKKLVKKTFLDENGLMRTKKSWESCSEDENYVKPQTASKSQETSSEIAKPETSKPFLKNDGSQKPKDKKQATILNFFSKKT